MPKGWLSTINRGFCSSYVYFTLLGSLSRPGKTIGWVVNQMAMMGWISWPFLMIYSAFWVFISFFFIYTLLFISKIFYERRIYSKIMSNHLVINFDKNRQSDRQTIVKADFIYGLSFMISWFSRTLRIMVIIIYII